MRTPWKLRTLAAACCVVTLIAGCQHGMEERAGGLVITSPDPALAIEAHYREGEHALVLRASPDGAAMRSEIIDERGHSVTQLASAILERAPLRTPEGELSVPLSGLFENARRLKTALQLSRHGLRQLREAIPAEAADAAPFRHLSQQTTVLHRALTQTRLALLQEWGNDAGHHITMTPDERAKFFAILNRHAAVIAARPAPAGRTADATRPAPDTEIAALLGPERYAQYKIRRQAWLVPVATDDLEVAP